MLALVKGCRTPARARGKAATCTDLRASVDAAFGGWAMRRTPKGEASLLRKLRRFMPAGPVDGSLRKTFGLV